MSSQQADRWLSGGNRRIRGSQRGARHHHEGALQPAGLKKGAFLPWDSPSGLNYPSSSDNSPFNPPAGRSTAPERSCSKWNGLIRGLSVWVENPELERRILGGRKDRWQPIWDSSAYRTPREEGRQFPLDLPVVGMGGQEEAPPLQDSRARTIMGSSRAVVRPQKCPGGHRWELEGLQRWVS